MGGQTAAPIRIALADDRTLVRTRLSTLLDDHSDLEVLPSGADSERATDEVRDPHPDVIVLDLSAPDGKAVDAVRLLREELPETQIVVVASDRDRVWAQPLLDAGARAVVAREAAEFDLAPAVRAVAHGERYVSVLVEAGLKPVRRARNRDRLTARETDVLRQIALGFTSIEIAQAFHLSPRTIETHRARIHEKLALSTRAELVRHAVRRGLLSS